MISIIIYGIIAVALASAAGYSFMVFTTSSTQMDNTLQNALRLDDAAAALRASLQALSPGLNGGLLFAPAGQTVFDLQGHQYTGIPASLGVANSSPWGQPFAYCPLSQTSTPNSVSGGGNTVAGDTVTSPDATTYQVSTFTGTATSNAPYVIGSTPGTGSSLDNASANGYVAFVLAARAPGLAVPSCDQVAYDAATNTVSVSGGSVRAVTAGYPFAQRNAASTDRLELYVGPGVTGDGSGRDVNNLATMDYAMNLWLSLQPRETTTWVTGTVAIDTSMNAEDARLYGALGEGPSLTIAGLGGTTEIVNLNTDLTQFPTAYELNSPVTFENIRVDVNSPITASKPVTLKNSLLNSATANRQVTVNDTTMLVENSNFSNIALIANNSKVEFYNLSGVTTTSSFTGSSLHASVSRVSFDGQSPGTIFNFTTTGIPSIYAAGSQINIGSKVTMNTSSNKDSVQVYASNLSVQGSLNVQGNATYGGLDAFAHSAVYVSGKISNNGANQLGMQYAVYLNGSTLGLEGTVEGYLSDVIGLQQSQLTSYKANGVITILTPGHACIDLIQGVPGMAPELNALSKTTLTPFKIYSVATDGTANDTVLFPQARYGMPPLAYWQNTQTLPGQTIDHNNAAYFPISPIVYSSGGGYPASTGQPIGYVDSTTLELAVRNIVNAEYITGASLNYSGKCNG